MERESSLFFKLCTLDILMSLFSVFVWMCVYNVCSSPLFISLLLCSNFFMNLQELFTYYNIKYLSVIYTYLLKGILYLQHYCISLESLYLHQGKVFQNPKRKKNRNIPFPFFTPQSRRYKESTNDLKNKWTMLLEK